MTWTPSPARCGVYCIINIAREKIYVGSSTDVFSRLREHFRTLRLNTHENARLQLSFNKYKEDAFGWFFLEQCDRAIKHEREQFWIDSFDAVRQGFNIRPRADAKTVNEETKRRISTSLKGHHVSTETLQAIRAALVGRTPAPRTPEWNAKIAATLRGRKRPPLSDEWKRKLALNAVRRPVDCFDLQGGFIGTFPRIKDAMCLTGGRRCLISLCLNGRKKTAYGYIWKDATNKTVTTV